MNRSEKTLAWIMRISAVLLITALFPAVMPFAWMDAVHRALGLGELPATPMVSYLTRSLSAMYAMHGALVFFVSLDVRRFLPVVKCLAVLAILFGIGMLVLDTAIGFPIFWVVCEGPFIVALGAVLLWLAGHVQQEDDEPSSP
jgi:hypothetical protein